VNARAEAGEDRFVTAFRRRVRVRVTGDGPPLLLVNGLGANLHSWQPLTDALPNRTVISFDAPGTGMSPAPAAPYGIARVAEVARHVLDAVGVEQADVLGYSFGGTVAQQLAHTHPGRVRRLVLVGTSCGVGAVPGALSALLAVMTPARHYPGPGHRLAMRMVRLAPAERRSAAVTGQIHTWQRQAPPSPRGYTLQVGAYSVFASLLWLHEIRQPTLVLNGTHDRLMPMANAAMLAAHLADARLQVFQDWGHYLLHDASSGAAATVDDFLAADTPAGSAAWQTATTVTPADLRRHLRAAPVSAHPAYFFNGLVRTVYAPRTRRE
jgi:pimeloyl-ACP methyl ester carboxylesterase